MSFRFKPLCSSHALNEGKLSGESLMGFAGGPGYGALPVCVCGCVHVCVWVGVCMCLCMYVHVCVCVCGRGGGCHCKLVV